MAPGGLPTATDSRRTRAPPPPPPAPTAGLHTLARSWLRLTAHAHQRTHSHTHTHIPVRMGLGEAEANLQNPGEKAMRVEQARQPILGRLPLPEPLPNEGHPLKEVLEPTGQRLQRRIRDLRINARARHAGGLPAGPCGPTRLCLSMCTCAYVGLPVYCPSRAVGNIPIGGCGMRPRLAPVTGHRPGPVKLSVHQKGGGGAHSVLGPPDGVLAPEGAHL